MRSFQVLGPVGAGAGDGPVALGGGRQLKLLAFLLVNANRAVSADALIDAVWGPERHGAIKRLHMAIARAHGAGEPRERGVGLDGDAAPTLEIEGERRVVIDGMAGADIDVEAVRALVEAAHEVEVLVALGVGDQRQCKPP